ncbi:MAG: cation diffusion facilitator family transporter [Clostridia bacterium]|nr:cation diffusion facilitator family transporter [Clostridia bacterium]
MEGQRSRTYYGMVSGIVSLGCNTVLFISKLIVGIIFGSMATVADALNNLTDFGTNTVSLIGFKVSSMPADKEHPYGHARAEYISALVVAFVILFLGIELIISAVENIITPQPSGFSYITAGVLLASILVKLFMFIFNSKLAKRIDSTVLRATAFDSLSDCISTGVVLLSLFIAKWTNVDLDSYMTILVALLILYGGFRIVKEAFSQLLGEAPTAEFVSSIKNRILSYSGVIGVHDLICHNYGAGKTIASVHVEVDANKPIMESHDIVDNIEADFAREMTLVIHMDPVVTDNPMVQQLKGVIEQFIQEIDQPLSIHDFRVVFGTTHHNLIFDVSVPYDCKLTFEQILLLLRQKVEQYDPIYNIVVTFDRT